MKSITGGVTAAKGFQAAAAAAEIKYKGRTDMAMIYSESPCAAAGTFTTNVVKAAYDKYYEKEMFVRVLDQDICPQTKWVEGSNYVDVNFKIDPRTKRIIMMGAMDNLMKGAAGQAIQNMNIMFGFEETEGLLGVPMFP